jgi:antitoxin component YwqK of YwqJK toxin-antitoxin module
VGDDYVHSLASKEYITEEGDTLVRDFSISAEFHQVLKERSFIHNKQNGLEVDYYANGTIKQINYYLNGRLWNVISRADSSGKLLNPGNLHDGNGVQFFSDPYGVEPNCYETYKNGLPEGPFYWQPDLRSCLKGELTYNPSVVQFVPAKKVTYMNPRGEKTTGIFDTSEYRGIFIDGADPYLKVLSVSDDSLAERSRMYKYIYINFDDPAVIPRGLWQVINTGSGKLMMTFVYDSNGNPVKVTRFKENGDISSQQDLPSYDKRKW